MLVGHCLSRVDPLRKGRVLGHLDPGGSLVPLSHPRALVSLLHGMAIVDNLQLQNRLSSALVGNQWAGDLQSTFLLLAMIQSAVSYEEQVLFDCQRDKVHP